jgi:hypothetical protein
MTKVPPLKLIKSICCNNCSVPSINNYRVATNRAACDPDPRHL